MFSEKNAKAEKTAINSQLGRTILRFWKSRGPRSISARLAYLAANLKIRKFGVVKITWNLSRIPKTSNFEKKVPEGNASRRILPSMATNLSKSLYYGNTVFFEKWAASASKSSSGRGAVVLGNLQKSEKIDFWATPKKKISYNQKLQQQLPPRRVTCRNHCKIKIFQKIQRQFWKRNRCRGPRAPTIIYEQAD